MKKNIKKLPGTPVVVIVCVGLFMLGFVSGLIVFNVSKSDLRLASTEEKAKAETDITNKYLQASSTGCSDPSDPVKPQDRIAVFKKYLKVNGYANRAVIRGCNDSDSLLYKNRAGEWQRSTVNVSLDRRANPKWQKACLIQDITRADTVERPENKSLDDINYQLCQQL